LGTLKSIRAAKIPYLFISPFYISFALFFLGPILVSFYMSLHEWGGGPARFIGWENYANLLADETFIGAFRNTVVLGLAMVVAILVCSVGLALVLNQPAVRFRNIFGMIYYLPIITSLVAVSLVFSLILDREIGLLNIILELFGIFPVDWLGDVRTALFSIFLVMLWRWTGYFTLIAWAGLQALPIDVYDAASVDGASALQKIRYVTLPLLRPVLAFITIITTITGFQTFTEVVILTSGRGSVAPGGPARSTITLLVYMYLQGFRYFNLGYASAIAYVLTILMLAVSLLQLKFVMPLYRK